MAEPVSHLICNLHHKLPGLIFLPRQLISCVQCAHLNPQNIFHYGLSEGGVGNYHEIPKLMRNKIEKRHVKKKIIIHTRQYLRGSAICLRPRSCRDFTIIREKYKVRQYSFSVSLKNNKNPNHKNNSFYILCIEFTMDYKTGQKIFPPPLHGLSLRKSPIKNHATLF